MDFFLRPDDNGKDKRLCRENGLDFISAMDGERATTGRPLFINCTDKTEARFPMNRPPPQGNVPHKYALN